MNTNKTIEELKEKLLKEVGELKITGEFNPDPDEQYREDGYNQALSDITTIINNAIYEEVGKAEDCWARIDKNGNFIDIFNPINKEYEASLIDFPYHDKGDKVVKAKILLQPKE